MKKTTTILLVLAAVMTFGGGIAYATGQLAQSSALSEEAAQNFAFIDAGISPEDAEGMRTEFEFEKGTFVYEIEFTADNIRYEYTVDSSNGIILEKESVTISRENATQDASAEVITVDRAKEIALEKAGLSESDVTFTKTKQKKDNGIQIYEIEFRAGSDAKYEYDIDAVSGEILKAEYKAAAPVAEDESKGKDQKGSGDDAAAAAEKQTEMISVDEAKSIALEKAGLSAEDVTFKKAKLEHDDGEVTFEIKFYIKGQKEYEYEIDAYSGTILEEEIEKWDND